MTSLEAVNPKIVDRIGGANMHHRSIKFLMCEGALLLALYLCLGCNEVQVGNEMEPVSLGLAGPFSGPQAPYGRMVQRGAELKVAELNDRTGEARFTYRLVLGDDQATPSLASAVAQELVSAEELPVVLGHFNSSCTLAAQPVYEAAGVPNISYGSTNDEIGSQSEWTFRTPYKNSDQGRTLARYASAAGFQTVAILRENEEYGLGLAEVFKEAAKDLAIDIVEEQAYDSSVVDFRSLWIPIRARKPDAVLLAGFFPQLQVAVAQGREMGIEAPFLAGDGVGSSTEYIDNAGNAAEGTVATGPFLVESERESVADFRRRFREKYGEEPDSWAVYAYDAVGLADFAITNVGPDRTAIRGFLSGLDSPEEAYPGLVGRIWFDEHGDAVNEDVGLAVVEDGRYRVIDIQSRGNT